MQQDGPLCPPVLVLCGGEASEHNVGKALGPNPLPMQTWFLRYRNEWLGLGVIAALTIAAVALPKAMAYAIIAGLP